MKHKLKQQKGLPAGPPRTLTDIVKMAENQLGLLPRGDDDVPMWKRRSVEVSRLKRSMSKNKRTVEELAATIEYLAQRKMPLQAIGGLPHFVDEALESGAIDRDDDLGDRLDAAMSEETDPEWQARLARAQGDARAGVLEEWESSRGR